LPARLKPETLPFTVSVQENVSPTVMGEGSVQERECVDFAAGAAATVIFLLSETSE